MIPDNTSEMIARDLHDMIKGWESNQLKEYCADRGMKWQFTKHLAPHKNGYTESIVKSTKSALKEVIAETILMPTVYEMFIAWQNNFVE